MDHKQMETTSGGVVCLEEKRSRMRKIASARAGQGVGSSFYRSDWGRPHLKEVRERTLWFPGGSTFQVKKQPVQRP